MKKKLVLALALTAIIVPLGAVGASASAGTCQVWSGGGWLVGACPTPKPTPTPSPTVTPVPKLVPTATPAPKPTPTVTATPTPKPTIAPVEPMPTERLAGASRYDTAALISAAHFAPGVKAVYIANGNGIDAITAGAAVSGPILTVPSTGKLPASTAKELERLNPKKVVVLGGTSSVSDNMLAQAVKAANR